MSNIWDVKITLPLNSGERPKKVFIPNWTAGLRAGCLPSSLNFRMGGGQSLPGGEGVTMGFYGADLESCPPIQR